MASEARRGNDSDSHSSELLDKVDAMEQVVEKARLVLEPYREYDEPYATPFSLELLRRAVDELDEKGWNDGTDTKQRP